MRILAAAVAVVAVATTLASARPALACGEDTDDVSPVVQPVSLLQQAARMDVQAASFEQSAVAARRQARMLDARAEKMRADAMAQEQRAAALRSEASLLRVRARGGRPGWRGAATVSL